MINSPLQYSVTVLSFKSYFLEMDLNICPLKRIPEPLCNLVESSKQKKQLSIKKNCSVDKAMINYTKSKGLSNEKTYKTKI